MTRQRSRGFLLAVLLVTVVAVVGSSASAQAADIHGTVTPGTSLATATPTSVAITVANQNAYYTFSVTAADVSAGKTIGAQLSNDVGLNGTFQILGVGNTVFYSSSLANTTYVTTPVTTPGTYCVLIDPASTNTGTAILKVIKAVDTHTTVTPGTSLGTASATSVSIPDPGQNAYYTFSVTAADVSAGKVIAAQISSDSGLNGAFQILDPVNSVFYNASIANTTYVTTPVTTAGTYTVLLDPATTYTGTASLKVIKPVDTHSTVAAGTSLTTATATSVSLPDPGQNGYYTFSVTAADVSAGKVIAAQVSSDTGLNGAFQILDPGGTVFYNASIANTSYVTTPVTTAGTYTVLLDPATTYTGTASLKVVKPVDTHSTVAAGTSLTSATATTVSIPDPGQNAYYTFTVSAADVSAGKTIAAQVSSDTGLNGAFQILDPVNSVFYNASIANTSYVTTPVTTAGTYTVLVDPATTYTGTAQLKVIEAVDVHSTVTPGTSLTTATATTVSLPDPGQNGYYTFTVTAADVSAGKTITAQISSETGLNGAFQILGFGGTVFYSSSIANTNYVTAAVTTPGTYTVLIDPATSYTGSATLKLIKS